MHGSLDVFGRVHRPSLSAEIRPTATRANSGLSADSLGRALAVRQLSLAHDQPEASPPGGELRTGLQLQLAENVVDVALCRSLGDDQLVGNLTVAPATDGQVNHLPLATCELLETSVDNDLRG